MSLTSSPETREFIDLFSLKRDSHYQQIISILTPYRHQIDELFEKTGNELKEFGFTNLDNLFSTRKKKTDELMIFITTQVLNVLQSSITVTKLCNNYDLFDDLLHKYVEHFSNSNQYMKNKNQLFDSNGKVDISLWGLHYTLTQFDIQIYRVVNDLYNTLTHEFYTIIDEYV